MFAKAYPVCLAKKGVRWNVSFGEWAKLSGVYVIHHADCIKYVGKTVGPTNRCFATRVREEFRETSHIYSKLMTLTAPPDIMVSFLPVKEIETMVLVEGIPLSPFVKVDIFEAVAIAAYEPEFQQPYDHRLRKHLEKIVRDEHRVDAMMSAFKGSKRKL